MMNIKTLILELHKFLRSDTDVASQVNDSFSHDRRDVMELIDAVLAGTVRPRDIPLVRVAWQLGLRTQLAGVHGDPHKTVRTLYNLGYMQNAKIIILDISAGRQHRKLECNINRGGVQRDLWGRF